MKTLVIAVLFTATLHAQQITIRAGTLVDGRGGLVRNTTLVIEGSRIVRIDPSIKNATYNLSSLTVMPGWIDTTPISQRTSIARPAGLKRGKMKRRSNQCYTRPKTPMQP